MSGVAEQAVLDKPKAKAENIIHLFHMPCQPKEGDRFAYCGHRLSRNGVYSKYFDNPDPETCSMCVQVQRTTGCTKCNSSKDGK